MISDFKDIKVGDKVKEIKIFSFDPDYPIYEITKISDSIISMHNENGSCGKSYSPLCFAEFLIYHDLL